MKILAITLVLAICRPLAAQSSVYIRIIDGNSGRAITKARLTIRTYKSYAVGQVQAAQAGKEYVITLDGEESIGLGDVSESSSSWNEYELCTRNKRQLSLFSVSQILTTGVAGQNDCSNKVGTKPTRGVAVFFVRHRSLWEKLRDYHFD